MASKRKIAAIASGLALAVLALTGKVFTGQSQKEESAGLALKSDSGGAAIEWDEDVSLLAALNIVECGSEEPYECNVYVASVAINRLEIAKMSNSSVSLRDVIYEPGQFTGIDQTRCNNGKRCIPTELMSKSLKNSIIGAAEAMNAENRPTKSTHYLNPRVVVKKYKHLPAWAINDIGALAPGYFAGSHYFFDAPMSFKAGGKTYGTE
jgi:spore germination cell wall hydrolase CwlJ-like protein